MPAILHVPYILGGSSEGGSIPSGYVSEKVTVTPTGETTDNFSLYIDTAAIGNGKHGYFTTSAVCDANRVHFDYCESIVLPTMLVVYAIEYQGKYYRASIDPYDATNSLATMTLFGTFTQYDEYYDGNITTRVLVDFGFQSNTGMLYLLITTRMKTPVTIYYIVEA